MARTLTVNPEKQLTTTTNTIQLLNATSDLKVRSNARIVGDFLEGGTSIQMQSGSSISQMDGTISNLIYTYGAHVGSGNTLAPGNYGETYLLNVGYSNVVSPLELLSGTYTFAAMLFGTSGASGGIHLDNSRSNANIRLTDS